MVALLVSAKLHLAQSQIVPKIAVGELKKVVEGDCEVCKCKDSPLCPLVGKCEAPLCKIIMDNNDCEICQCNKCPELKCRHCKDGYKNDKNGCQTCMCAPHDHKKHEPKNKKPKPKPHDHGPGKKHGPRKKAKTRKITSSSA